MALSDNRSEKDKNFSPGVNDTSTINNSLTLPDNSEEQAKRNSKTEDELKNAQSLTTLDYAKIYLSKGLSIIPLKPKSKEPLIAWKEYQNRRARGEEVKEWFKEDNNIGIVCGTISGNLVVLDFDDEEIFKKWYDFIDKEYPEIRDTILNTWIIRTGRGRHIYLRVNEDEKEFKERFRNKLKLIDGVDVKGEGGYVVAPPSVHPSGKHYDFLISHNDTDIDIISKKDFNIILKTLREIGKPGEEKAEQKEEANKSTKRVSLTEDQIKQLVEILSPYYKEGYRDALIHFLLGAFVKIGIDRESAEKVIERLAILNNDEEKENRLYQVKWTYEKRVNELDKKEFKGFGGLREIIEKQELDAVRDIERAKDKAIDVITTISEIIGTPIEPNTIRAIKRLNIKIRQFYANDPDRGILLVTNSVDGGKPDREYLFSYYIERVKIYVNPIDREDVKYGVVFRHAYTHDILTYEERTIAEIVTDIVDNVAGLRSIDKIKGAISSLIDAFVSKGIAEKVLRIPATGFFEIDNQLMFYEDPGFKVKLPEVDKEKTKEALKQLDELLAFWDYKDHVIANFYFDIQAPLGFIRKQYQRENKILLNYGESHVGKTLRDKIYCMIWGLDESRTIIGSSNITAPQIAEYLNKTTFKIVFDEARNIFKYDSTADLIKNATTQTHIKDRIMPHLGFRVKHFISYASISMNLNYLEINVPGIETRLIPLKWTVADKKKPDEVEEFMKKLTTYKDNLAYIGSYLKDMFIRRWKEVKEIIINNDQIEAGRKILEILIEELGIPKPQWLRDVKVDYEIETPDDEEIFFNFIREELQNAIAKHRYVMEVSDNSEYRRDLLTENWINRLEWMAKAGILPSFITLGRTNVYIYTDIIREIRQKKNYEIAGGLENMALRLGYKYDTRHGKKAMFIPIVDLAKRLGQYEEEEEE